MRKKGEKIVESRAEQSRAEQSRAEQSRAGYIDVFRGIGILLMVMGHINSFGGYFDKFIHAFHVPMFFVISGYLFRVNSYSLSDIIKKE